MFTSCLNFHHAQVAELVLFNYLSIVQLSRSIPETGKQAKQDVNPLQKCISYGERSLTAVRTVTPLERSPFLTR